MKLTEVEVVPYALPFERPYVTARGTLERREMVLVRLITDEGLVGLGEAVPLALRGGADLAAVERGIRKGTRRLRRSDLSDFAGRRRHAGRGRRVHPHGRRAPDPGAGEGGDRDGGLRPRRQGLRADRCGRCSARPRRRPSPATRPWSPAPPAAVADDAERWAARGFTTFKLKLGVGDDVAQVRAVREAVGPEARIRVDANGAWSVDEALGVLRMLEPLGIELVEQPVGTLAEMAEVTAALTIPIAADETVDARQGRRAREARGRLRPGDGEARPRSAGSARRTGSPGRCRSTSRARSTARSGSPPRRMPPRRCRSTARRPASRTGSPPSCSSRPRSPRRECALDGPLLTPPDGPGLGVEIDEDALAEHRIGLAIRLADGPDQPQHGARLGDGRGARALRRSRGGDLPRLALDPAGAGAVARARDRGAGDRRRALGRLLRARRGAGDRGRPSRSSAPRGPPRPTSTPPSARPTSRACR